jgi:NurA-like 5'-3' nuclease
MKTIQKNPKKELLLGAGLNVLHQESKEWLDSIAFWTYETQFFKGLLIKANTGESRYQQMLQTLDSIYNQLFKFLKKDIIDHEKKLSKIVELEAGFSDESYREEHKRLSESMSLLTQDFKELKMTIFDFVKNTKLLNG